ncbi:response regulator transcription factor [Akkermansiaceae bacterium]|nr:response regulator transcription factor [Akkermansiaceae bacterium]
MPKKKTVVIVEDDIQIQEHLIEILKVADDIEFLGAVGSAEEAEDFIPGLHPDVVLMDINLPGKSGIECIRELKRRLPKLEVVMLTAYEEEDNIFRALKEGASGYILKSSNSKDIIEAIRDVFAGESPFSGPIARKMAMFFREKREIEDERESLSPRETEVLRLLAAGYIHKEVADEMGITLPTVRTYVKRICFKLHVRSKVEAIIKYLS